MNDEKQAEIVLMINIYTESLRLGIYKDEDDRIRTQNRLEELWKELRSYEI